MPTRIKPERIFVKHVLTILVPHSRNANQFCLNMLKCLFDTPLINLDGPVDLSHRSLDLIRAGYAFASSELGKFEETFGGSPGVIRWSRKHMPSRGCRWYQRPRNWGMATGLTSYKMWNRRWLGGHRPLHSKSRKRRGSNRWWSSMRNSTGSKV